MKYFFVSYTVRDGFITSKELKEIESFFGAKKNVYIDLLHNKSKVPQINVFKELLRSDIFILIETKKIYTSPWVKAEVLLAKLFRKKIIKIKLSNLNKLKEIIENY